MGDGGFCTGYMDAWGKWSNGFPCPPSPSGDPVYCCGSPSFKYCCTPPAGDGGHVLAIVPR